VTGGRRRPPLACLVLVLLMALAVASGCTGGSGGTTSTSHAATSAPARLTSPPVPSLAPVQVAQPQAVCGTSFLNSPFSYAGTAGQYRSGTAGLPTYGAPGTDFPAATAGVVLPAGTHSYAAYQLPAKTVFYLLPGKHVGAFQASAGDAFVGGLAYGVATVVSGEYQGLTTAFDSNFSDGDTPGVTIEYLTIEKFSPGADAAAINQSANTGWTLRSDTVTLNVPGAGVIAGADNVLEDNCLTANGQYGFQAFATGNWGKDALTGGPYDITVEGNEISYNDTCDFEGLLTNKQVGWNNRDPVAAQYRNPHCGTVHGDGNQGGFKLWETNGVTVRGNLIKGNWGPGAWVDTNNANTTFTGNSFTRNDAEAIIEEISYNFAITGNYMAYNGWAIGLDNPGFPTPAVYVSESGSVPGPTGVPACGEPSCAGQPSYPAQSAISGNELTDNGGGVFLWQNSNRYCSSPDPSTDACTLVRAGSAGSAGFTVAGCKANLLSASINPGSLVGDLTGSPPRDWWDGCQWKTASVGVSGNAISFQPSDLPGCVPAVWPACGANGLFSEYASYGPYSSPYSWAVDSQITFGQGNQWSGNAYIGPSTFYAWNQNNPVSWADWTGSVAGGDRCGSAVEHANGGCTGPFGQDAGSSLSG
jgi:parallel beta-helix repeat protein